MNEPLLPVGQCLHPVEAEIVRMALRLPARPSPLPLDLWNLQQMLPATALHLQACDAVIAPHGTQAAAGQALARWVRGESDMQRCTSNPRPTSTTAGGQTRRGRLQYPQVRVLASTLLEVCWGGDDRTANSREVYRLAWLPSVDTWVVTAFADLGSPGRHRDQLLSAIEPQADVIGAACQVIVQHWQRMRLQHARPRWVSMRAGRVDGVQAKAMADGAWPPVRPTVCQNDGATQQQAQPACC
jgi:hypothetical protein